MLALAQVLAHFDPAKKHGKEYRTRCPAHPDQTPSLDIADGTTGPVFQCRSAGCATRDILAAAGLTWDDVLPARASTPQGFAAIYDYRDAAGILQYQVLRKVTPPGQPKQFAQRHPDSSGGWVWKMNGIARIPYRLHELAGHARVFIPEGEKDADRLWAAGLPATCNTGGAKKWHASDAAALKTAGVQRAVLLQDNDTDGAAHVVLVAQHLRAAGIDVLTLPAFPDVAQKGDISDWLDRGHTIAELEALVLEQTPAVVKDFPGLRGTFTMLEDPEGHIRWLVEDRIPAGSVCLLVAKPKVGKTTAARHLAVAVARGDEWLGCPCTKGVVWYLAFEGQERDHKAHFRQFDLVGEDDAFLRCYIGPMKPELWGWMRAEAAVHPPALIIIDTLQRFLQVKSMEDYAEVTKAFDPVIAFTRATGAAMLLIHHAGKALDRDPLDSVLGSTAIAGSVDNTLVLAKLAGFRTVTSRQRIGPDLDERVIQLSKDGRVTLGDAREAAELRVVMDKLYLALANAPEKRLLSVQWLELVEGRKQTLLRAMRALVVDKAVTCVGTGTKANPYVYSVPAVPAVPAVPSGSEPPEPHSDDFFVT